MNALKFQQVLDKRGLKKEDLAKIIDKDRATIYRRFANKSDTFTVEEAQKIKEALDLTDEEAISIFFD